MENQFSISLSDYVLGPDELNQLLDAWKINPQPKTVNDLARLHLALRVQQRTGYIPYDRRRRYDKGDKLVVRVSGRVQPCLGEVVGVTRDAGIDTDGFRFDKIDLYILSRTLELCSNDTRSFVANYRGRAYAGPAVEASEIIAEKDEQEVVPKLLRAISDDRRLVHVREWWLPYEALNHYVADQIPDIREVLAKAGCALSTKEILCRLGGECEANNASPLWQFTVDYFLSQHPDQYTPMRSPDPKWQLRIPRPPEDIESSITVKDNEWLAEGWLELPSRVSKYMVGKTTVQVLYDRTAEVLPYEESVNRIVGMGNFYRKKGVCEGDRIILRLEGLETARIFVRCAWRTDLDTLLHLEPQRLDWEGSPLRDCVIVTLAMSGAGAHYREIYAEIVAHRHASISAVIATLSRHCPSLFMHMGMGKWRLAGLTEGNGPIAIGTDPATETTREDDTVWEAVRTIEDQDYVYNLLKKLGRPLSFSEICKELSGLMRIDARALQETGFLNGGDERLRRLDDNTWALSEWFTHVSTPAPAEDDVAPSNSHTLLSFLRIVLYLLLILLLARAICAGIRLI